MVDGRHAPVGVGRGSAAHAHRGRAATATELRRHDHLVVCIDVAHRGLGAASCGPDVLSGYRLPAGGYEFSYMISGRTAPN